MADGADDRTWRRRLEKHDVSRWIAEAIKDEELAAEARNVENAVRDPAASRRAMREAIERRHTALAKAAEAR